MAQFQSFLFQDDKNKNVFGFIRMNWLLSSRDIYVIQRYDPCTTFTPPPPPPHAVGCIMSVLYMVCVVIFFLLFMKRDPPKVR